MRWSTLRSLDYKPAMDFRNFLFREGLPEDQMRDPRYQFGQVLHVAVCSSCHKMTIWEDFKLVYPQPLGIEPCEDMPESIKEVFVEAQRVTYLSPRSACALLRVCLERLCDTIADLRKIDGYKRDAWLWQKIEKLKLQPEIKEIFDTVKDVGNSGSHGNNKAAEIDFTSPDSVEVAIQTAEVINALVRILISPLMYAQKMQRHFKQRQ